MRIKTTFSKVKRKSNTDYTCTSKNRIEQLQLVIPIYCTLRKLRLSKTEVYVLAKYVVDGVTGEVDDKILKSTGILLVSLRNIKTKLHNMGFLTRHPELYKTYKVNNKFETEIFTVQIL